MLNSILLQLTVASDTVQQVAAPAATASEPLSLWSLVLKGGLIMVPIAFLSLLAVYLFIERFIVITRAQRGDANMLNAVKDFLYQNNFEAARAYCRNSNTPVGRMIEAGLKRLGKPMPEVERSIENAGKLEVAKMERNIGLLGTIAGIAPMFGFLGTISGVIKIFYNIALADNISIGLIAGGLYEKMITSAAGLLVGIMAFVFHHVLLFMIDRAVHKMEVQSYQFIDIIQE